MLSLIGYSQYPTPNVNKDIGLHTVRQLFILYTALSVCKYILGSINYDNDNNSDQFGAIA